MINKEKAAVNTIKLLLKCEYQAEECYNKFY